MTGRIPLDDMNSDQLDALYERLEFTEAALARIRDGLEVQVVRLTKRAEQAEVAIERVRTLHQPMGRGPFTVCTHCSGWNGFRCEGVVTPHPCPTLEALDAQPAPDSRTAAAP